MSDLARPYVALYVPAYRATCWSQQLPWLFREAQSRHLASVHTVEHRPIGQARNEIMRDAFELSDVADAVIMLDDDIVVDCLADPGRSLVDHVVRQWSRAEPWRVLYAAATWQSAITGATVLNEERPDHGGETLRGGSACMLVPRAVWKRAQEAGIVWRPVNEDYQFCDDVRRVGMRVEPICGIRTRHRSEWRPPLVAETDDEGRARIVP